MFPLQQIDLGPTPWRSGLTASLFFLFPIALGLSNIVLLALIIIWVFSLRFAQGRQEIMHNPIIWLLGGLYVVVLLGAIHTPADDYWVALHLRKYARLIYAIVLICLLIRDEYAQRFAMWGFVGAMLITLISTWLNIWFLIPWSASQNLGWGQSHHVFGDYITQNLMMSFFCTLTLHFAVSSNKFIARGFWLTISLMAAISITHLSSGRTGFVVLSVSLVTYVWVITSRRNRLLALLALTLLAAAAFLTSDILKSRFLKAVEEVSLHKSDVSSSIGNRLYNYKTTPLLIAEKPIFGHGTGSYHVEICRVIDDPSQCSGMLTRHPHNQFLFLGAEHGMVGMALYLAIIISMYRIASRAKDSTSKVWLTSLASILLVNSMLNSPLWSSIESQFFMYMLALGVAMAQSKVSRHLVGK